MIWPWWLPSAVAVDPTRKAAGGTPQKLPFCARVTIAPLTFCSARNE